jgi:uncharacterized membrane protein YgcG
MKHRYFGRIAAMLLVLAAVCLCWVMPAGAETAERVYDPAELLTPPQAEKLADRLEALSAEYGVELYFATYEAENAYDDFYGDDYCREVKSLHAGDAVLLIVTYELGNRTYYYDMYTYGKANSAINQKEVDYILDTDAVYRSIKGGNVTDGAETFFEMSAKAFAGRVGAPWIQVIGVSAVIAVVIALIICGGVVASYKRKKASVDYPLDQYAKLNLTLTRDDFVREYTTRTYSPQSSGNSSGGKSRHGGGGGHRGGR